jgi:hypothetical protein
MNLSDQTPIDRISRIMLPSYLDSKRRTFKFHDRINIPMQLQTTLRWVVTIQRITAPSPRITNEVSLFLVIVNSPLSECRTSLPATRFGRIGTHQQIIIPSRFDISDFLQLCRRQVHVPTRWIYEMSGVVIRNIGKGPLPWNHPRCRPFVSCI